MPKLIISKDFLRHFREKRLIYKFRNEQRYRDIRYRQYRGKYNESGALYSSLAGKLNDSYIVMRLASHLQKEEIPRIKCLAGFVQQFIKLLLRKTPETGTFTYSSALIFELKGFVIMIDTFQRKMQQEIFHLLHLYMDEKEFTNSNLQICSEDIRNLHQLTDHYFELLKERYDHFTRLLQKESHEEYAIIITSETGKRLLELIEVIEKSFLGIYDTLYLLESWKTRLRQREMQEVYN